MERWSIFDADQLAEIARLVPPAGERVEAQVCPSCGLPTLRWYRYRNPLRADSKITYVWCSACRLFVGETTASPTWELPDPLEDLDADGRAAIETSPDSLFARLDGLWECGDLPQVRRSGGTQREPVPGDQG